MPSASTKKHSKLGASASDRWMNCPGSIRASAGIPSVESAYALEGTVAHEVCELLLRDRIRAKWGPVRTTLPAEIKGVEITDEMVEHCEVYVDFIASIVAEYPDAEVEIEQRFALPELHPDLFGTADCVIYIPSLRLLIVIDFKYGRGIAVEVVGNPQLRYYAAGAAFKKHNRGLARVRSVIVQPRCPHPDGPIRSDEISALELMDWSSDLVAAAKRTEAPDAPLVPGDWCKFCPAAPTCQALREDVLRKAQADFADDGTLHLSDPLTYSAQQVWDLLPAVDQIEDWCRGIRNFAHHEAEAGRCDPRFKLVATRATRKWKDEFSVLCKLSELQIDRERCYVEPKLKSPAQMEKEVGKMLKPFLQQHIESVSSGTVLAPADDPRPPVKPEATAEFSVIES